MKEFPLIDVRSTDMLFGVEVSKVPTPNEIPKEFHNCRNKYCEMASELFFNGGKIPPVKVTGDQRPIKLLKAILCSFDLSHEHKEALAGWLLATQFKVK